MTKLRILLIPALALAMTAFASAGEWMTDYKAALALSKKTGKPVMADFTGSDWCGWCIRLHKEVFDTPGFAAWAKKNVILLELDYPQRKALPAGLKMQNDQLAEKYKIEGYPTILFLDSKGQILGNYGYDSGGPSKWTQNADKMIKGKKV
jgi:protein disulfide-isomerase